MSEERLSIPASEVKATLLPTIWRERIPVGTLSVIAGKPGLGKSTLSVTIAAELSRSGLPVVLSNLEDDLAAITRPRLDVAKANLPLVHMIPHDMAPLIPKDLARLEELIVETKAACAIMDPFGAHFAPERRVHDRPTLRQVVGIARRTKCAIVAIHHTVKNTQGQAIDAFGGPTGGLLGTARAAYLYGYDPDDEDRRALSCAKINGVDEPATLVFDHDIVEYDAGGYLIEAGRLRAIGEKNVSAKKVLTRGKTVTPRDHECNEWLTNFLAAGDDMSRQVSEIRRTGTAEGFSWSAVRRAGVALKTEKTRVGFGTDGFWLWRLPDEHPLRKPSPEPETDGE